jgi:hypothetical protein
MYAFTLLHHMRVKDAVNGHAAVTPRVCRAERACVARQSLLSVARVYMTIGGVNQKHVSCLIENILDEIHTRCTVPRSDAPAKLFILRHKPYVFKHQ